MMLLRLISDSSSICTQFPRPFLHFTPGNLLYSSTVESICPIPEHCQEPNTLVTADLAIEPGEALKNVGVVDAQQ